MFVSLSHEINEKWQLVLLFCPVVLPVGSSLVKSIVWHHHAPFRHKTKHVTHTKTCFKNVFHCITVKPIHTWSIEVPFNQPYACIMSFWKAVKCWNWLDFVVVVSWLRPSFAPSSFFWSFVSFELRYPLNIDCSWKLNRKQTNTSFNIQQPVEMTWCTHKSFDYLHLTIIISLKMCPNWNGTINYKMPPSIYWSIMIFLISPQKLVKLLLG